MIRFVKLDHLVYFYKIVVKWTFHRLAEPSTEENSEKNIDKKVQRNQTEPINYSVKSKDDSENHLESAVQQSQESLENKEDHQVSYFLLYKN